MVSNGSMKKRSDPAYLQFPSMTSLYQDFRGCSARHCHISLLTILVLLSLIAVLLYQSIDFGHQLTCLSAEDSRESALSEAVKPNTTLYSSGLARSNQTIDGEQNSTFKAAEEQVIRGFKNIPEPNKAWLLQQLKENLTGDACHEVETVSAQVFFGTEMVSSDGNVQLQTDRDYDVMIVAYGPNGTKRCSGGDFFELDVNGTRWKSRPPIRDLGDGTYIFRLRVSGEFPGVYVFRVILLFPNWHGMELDTQQWAVAKDIAYLEIEFINLESRDPSAAVAEELKLCNPEEDYKLKKWEGRWTRRTFNDSCMPNEQGRFLCLEHNQSCEGQWCKGEVGRLESNGWVYSAHCSFRIFTTEEAWDCMAGKWLFFWGDSNHQDTIRNLLNFPLGIESARALNRNSHGTFRNPRNSSQTVTMTNSFNGHYLAAENNLGLESLTHPEHREDVIRYFNGTVRPSPPDVVIMNSGLHDGNNWPDLEAFARAAENASAFWKELWAGTNEDESRRAKMVYRMTVAPAGFNTRLPGRNTKSNVQKHDIFNAVMVDTFLSEFGPENLQLVDSYDMTFPWHYDHMCSDGPHYGRPPNPNSWIPGGHQYFVDLMLTHVLLNAICPSQ
ncbi:hypothetical protein R1sor_004042 [Riccia sorocarpa]|uniref:Uncharacterized protein n=1 Tax=Riccia sorocarpa TaxID=122646 RepID=A0ABD3H6P9_9MARC